MDQKKPRSREKNVTSGGSGVHRRGEGLGTGPVGSGSQAGKTSGGSGPKRAAAGGGSLLLILALVILPKLLGGGSSDSGNSGGSVLGDIVGGLTSGDSSDSMSFGDMTYGGYSASSESSVDNTVAEGSRPKRTQILGNGQDKVTIMVYMCGTDLESKYGMASSDMQEMAAAKYGDNVDIIVYTGGCNEWKTSGISNKSNQIYRIKNGGLEQLVSDDGSKPMTNPDTLASFIQFCSKNYPANRNELILWDHGGGSVSGYGYDEKNKSAGSMDIPSISKALKKGGVTFDFVGFDACLMATAETALMLNDYADYLIASEETEPGVGWFYTNWLTELGKNTSMPTVEIGKNIVDDFITTCAKKCKGQKTTLSVIDVAEFSNTVPQKLDSFAVSVSGLIGSEEYQKVSDARNSTREFAESSKIDQVDLVNLAENTATQSGAELAAAIRSAVKYNRTSSNMSNAYGVSIYFPYKRTSYVDNACSTFDQIGMNQAYSKCIRQFAKLETSGQIAAGGTGSALGSLFGTGGSSSASGSADVITSLLGSFLGGSSGKSIAGLDSSNSDFMSESSFSNEENAEFISMHHFDASNLVWGNTGDEYIMSLPDDQWGLIHTIDLNMFYDDGEGFVDLGLDNIYSFDDDGNLVADTDRNWLSIDGHTVAYYHTDTTEINDEWTITGYVPALLNGEKVKVILVFDTENPNGYVAGAVYDYENSETETIAKSMTELEVGDTLDFLCDFYSYDGVYQDSYFLGESLTVSDNIKISNTDVGSGEVRLMYRFTDIYNQEYWSEAIIK